MRELQRIFSVLPASLRWRWFALLPLILIAALIEAVGAAAVFALLRVLSDPSTVSTLPFAARLGLGPGSSPTTAVIWIAGMVMAVYAVRLVVLGVVTEVREFVGYKTIVRLSHDLLNRYLQGPLIGRTERGTADMMFRVERGTAIAVILGIASATQLVAECLVAAALVALLAITAPATTFLAVFITAGLLLLPAAFSRTLFARWGKQEERAEVQLRQQLRDGFGALREIKVYGREEFFRGRVTRASSHLAHFRHRQGVGREIVRLTVETIFVLVLLAMVGALTWLSGGNNVVPVMGLYAFAGFRFVPSANRITLYINNINGARPVIRELVDDFDAFTRDRDDTSGGEVLPFNTQLRFEDVGVVYQGGTRPALQHVDLTIAKGESVGIVGPSGAGKSTLVDVLLGLIDPTSGRLTVDGRDVASVHRAWQRNIGYVAQSFYLLDDTLRRNIAFGVEVEQIDDVRLQQVVRAARLEELVATLPDGLNTPIGEGGMRLSGGERQRVAIARALYARPSVLILDEATAALDPLTEREVTDAIAAFRGTITMVVIAHRMSTVKGCDRLIMLREGRVHSVGRYEELLESDDDFRALVTGEAQQTG